MSTPGTVSAPGTPSPRLPPAGPPGSAGRHRFAYFPFGGGPRVCIGNPFALLEGPLVLATILQHFQVEVLPGQAVVPDPTFTLRPKYGIKVRLWPR
jgi:cytochrome P450